MVGTPPERDATHALLAALAIAGLVLGAAVLPAVAHSAPGSSLIPDREGGPGDAGTANEGDGGTIGGAIDRLLNGAGRGESSGSTVGGLLGSTSERAGSTSGGSVGSPGIDVSRTRGELGALNPGRRAGVGSRGNPVSRSLRNQSTRAHFVVRSSHPSYWRTSAYGQYTGAGWESRGTPTRTDWPLPVSPAADERRTITQEVVLLRPATSLPVAWEPTDVDLPDGAEAVVTERRGVRAPGSLPANTTYTVVSAAPPRDPGRLRRAGRDYPTAIEERYTQLPGDTPARLERFTDRLTANASTPYQEAVAVERWLEANKAYSLNASHEGGDVASQFVFEMDRGYCEYFATSMTVMLRTQGIPARYAVGYSTGEPRGEDTYLVRGMNAHAWVEVYFPETGWVRFDPTPGRNRLASESRLVRQALANGSDESVARQALEGLDEGGSRPPGTNTGGDSVDAGERVTGDRTTAAPAGGDDASGSTFRFEGYNHTEEGSPGESFDPTSDSAYRIALSADPVPGRPVTVRVTRGGSPAAGVLVRFNGERVGLTGANGSVRGEVPFARTLVIDVREPAGSGRGALGPPVGTGAQFALAGARFRGGADDGENTSRSYQLPTNLTLAVAGTPEPGQRVGVQVRLGGTPVPDATVRVDGQRVGRTDDRGQVAVTLPAAETTTIAATRGAASGNRTLRLAAVAVNVSGLALPGLGVGVAVTDAGRPVEGATVELVGNGRTAETGADGRARVSLPLATGARLRVTTPTGVTVTRPVPYGFLTVAGWLVAALSALGALVVLGRRTAGGERALGRDLASVLQWLSGAFVSLLVGAAAGGERVIERLPALLGRLRRLLGDGLGSVAAALRELELPSGRAALAWLLAAVRALLADARASLSRSGTHDGTGTAAPTPSGGTDRGRESLSPRERVRRAWRELRARVPLDDPRTKTPGEVARSAVEAGHPRTAVETLTEAVRAVEYGGRDPREYLEPVETARERLGETNEDPVEDRAVTDGGERA